jgi:hypothetical protein
MSSNKEYKVVHIPKRNITYMSGVKGKGASFSQHPHVRLFGFVQEVLPLLMRLISASLMMSVDPSEIQPSLAMESVTVPNVNGLKRIPASISSSMQERNARVDVPIWLCNATTQTGGALIVASR